MEKLEKQSRCEINNNLFSFWLCVNALYIHFSITKQVLASYARI